MPFWIYMTPLLIIILGSLLGSKEAATWHPMQSDQVKEICSNMTARERRSAIKRGALAGLALAGVFALVGLMSLMFVPGSALKGLLMAQPAVLLVLGLAFWKLKPRMDQSAKEFYASTDWARERGLGAADIVLRRG